MKDELQYSNVLSSWQGTRISVNGNPDIYILRAYDGNYYLPAYSYDKELERGSFSLYIIGSDESGRFANIGMKPCKITLFLMSPNSTVEHSQ